MEVLWPMDRAVDGGEGQPGHELFRIRVLEFLDETNLAGLWVEFR